MVLAALGAIWLSVRGQHPYRGLTAADIPDHGSLGVRTYVNGKLTQQGNTRDMITTVPALIEYLSSFMTLNAGDVILTGTPEGAVNVDVGDEVVCEIDGLGRLQNTIVGDELFGR